jgi:hypothetical protein
VSKLKFLVDDDGIFTSASFYKSMPKGQSEENSVELISNEETFGKRNSDKQGIVVLLKTDQMAVRASLTASTKAKADGVHLG